MTRPHSVQYDPAAARALKARVWFNVRRALVCPTRQPQLPAWASPPEEATPAERAKNLGLPVEELRVVPVNRAWYVLQGFPVPGRFKAWSPECRGSVVFGDTFEEAVERLLAWLRRAGRLPL